MAIPTSRTHERAIITIDTEKCMGCGKCVTVCKDLGLQLLNGKATVSKHPVFGCFACGHCVAVCPSGAIQVSGRTLSNKDFFSIPAEMHAASFEQLTTLYKRRRSIREFKDKPLSEEVVTQIIEAASFAPMGLPPSDVHLLVLHGRDKTRKFASDFCQHLESMRWMTSKWFLSLMKPLWGKSTDEIFRNFVTPLLQTYTREIGQGVNLVTYDAPLAIYFYGSPYADPADPIVAATTAMYAGESLGLGTCMIGAVHPLIQSGPAAAKFRKQQGIKYKSREGIIVLFGYPDISYSRSIKRSFAHVSFGAEE